MFKKSYFKTPLGWMVAVSSAEKLYFLKFVEQEGDEPLWISRFQRSAQGIISSGSNQVLLSIKKELAAYFKGELTIFNTAIELIGTSFQKKVWKALMRIPYGQTWSYLETAQSIEQPTAYRALANANGANPLAVIIPCHRVINNNGALGGYTGGLEKKAWLLNLEILETNKK